MSTFLLVSGAWHAAWCWRRLTPLLEAEGHMVVAPDLLGMGGDPTPLGEVTLARWADQIADLARAAAEPVVLVGHSRGGIVISEAAERAPDHVGRLVYLAAGLVPDGLSLQDVFSSAPPPGEFVELQPDGSATLADWAVAELFYSTTDAEGVALARAHASAEPISVFATPLHLTEARFGRTPRAYVECALDRAVPLELQRAMQAQLPCEPVVTLQTDHSPFFSAPAELAAALVGLARAEHRPPPRA